jgi:septal ring factor EnvC (AmiA/AmiB activator)
LAPCTTTSRPERNEALPSASVSAETRSAVNRSSPSRASAAAASADASGVSTTISEVRPTIVWGSARSGTSHSVGTLAWPVTGVPSAVRPRITICWMVLLDDS